MKTRTRSPRRPSTRLMAADELPDTIPYRYSYVLHLPYIIWEHIFAWFAFKIVLPIVKRYSWYSGAALRLVNGDRTPCNFTAIMEFSKSIGQPSTLVGRETEQKERCSSSVISWRSISGKRPLLLVVQWSRKNFSKAHFFHYEDGYLTHSASFGSNATWSQKSVGYSVRRDSVEDRLAFDDIALDSEKSISASRHTRILRELVQCMRNVKGSEHHLKFDKVKRKIFLYAVHRTHLKDEKTVSLILQSKNPL